jgi:hypothetical protein
MSPLSCVSLRRGRAGWIRTLDLKIRSPVLYHYATAEQQPTLDVARGGRESFVVLHLSIVKSNLTAPCILVKKAFDLQTFCHSTY